MQPGDSNDSQFIHPGTETAVSNDGTEYVHVQGLSDNGAQAPNTESHLAIAIGGLKQEKEELKHKIASLRKQRDEARSDRAEMRGWLREWEEYGNQSQTQLQQAMQRIAESDSRIEQLQSSLSISEKGRTTADEKAHEALERNLLLEKEVASLREFLCLHDFGSEAELKDLVGHINDLVEDVSQRTADHWEDHPRTEESILNPLKRTAHISSSEGVPEDQLRGILGTEFFGILKRNSPTDDTGSFYMQWGIQAMIIKFIASYL
ncbi:hypothetical protein FRB99_001856, partial [Tulasnella sp. 403]